MGLQHVNSKQRFTAYKPICNPVFLCTGGNRGRGRKGMAEKGMGKEEMGKEEMGNKE